jgi:hypothetical protein
MTFGKAVTVDVAAAPAAFVTDFVIAAMPATARTAEAVAAYLRNSLRLSSGLSSPSLGIAPQLRTVQQTVNGLKVCRKNAKFFPGRRTA